MELSITDKRFYDIFLKRLKSYNQIFTIKFLVIHNIPFNKGNNHDLLLRKIENWITDGDISRYQKLIEYTDELILWGRQRTVLFNIRKRYRSYLQDLSNPAYVKNLVGEVYDNPKYDFYANQPFLAHVKHIENEFTHENELIFKFVETMKFDRIVKNIQQTFEVRLTNFFIIN